MNIVLSACHVPKLSAGRAFDNLTAYYNGYFNAKELYKQDLKRIDLANPDHYDRVLSLYKLGDEASASGLAADMDRIIEKTSALIKRHEKSDWIDDAYLLMGKAYYLKGDYSQALDNFQFVYNNLPDAKMKEAGIIWAARAYMKLEKKEEAQAALDLALGSDPLVKSKNSDELYATAAQFFLDERDSSKAMTYLLTGAENANEHLTKVRFFFILAQLSELRKEKKSALTYYRTVQHLGPPYELEFGAKLGVANSLGTSQETDAELAKLLKDAKNVDYIDQIYYTQASIALRNKHVDEAIRLYNKSLAHNTGNTNQKGLAYEQLGRLYMNIKKDYLKSSTYYDSTLAFLDKNYPNYSALQKMQRNLEQLSQNYAFIAQEDTLLLLADMSQSSRAAKIQGMVEAQVAKQKAREQAAIQEYKAKLAASSVRYATAAGVQTGNGINAIVPQNSFLQTTGGFGAGGLSSYTPAANYQMQIYAQGANAMIPAFGAGSGLGSSSSFGGSYGSYGGGASYGSSSAFGGAVGGYAGGFSSSFGSGTAGFGSNTGGFGSATGGYGGGFSSSFGNTGGAGGFGGAFGGSSGAFGGAFGGSSGAFGGAFGGSSGAFGGAFGNTGNAFPVYASSNALSGGQGIPGQVYAGQNYGNQGIPGQVYAGQNYGNQGIPGQAYAGQNYGNQGIPGQVYAGQNYGNQGIPGQPYAGQDLIAPPSGGATLYGGRSYSTIGNGTEANGGSTGTVVTIGSGIDPQTYPGQTYSNYSQNSAFPQNSNGTTTPFVPNTLPVSNSGLIVTSQNNGQVTYTNPAYAGQQQGVYQNQGVATSYVSSPYTSNPSNPYASGAGNIASAFGPFYFGNPATMSQGYGQFIQQWGNRPLRDNWRRSVRTGAETADETLPDSVSISKSAPTILLQEATNDPKKLEESLSRLVPSTQKQKDSMTERILDAYIAIATIYENDLHDYPNTIATYEEILRRFPYSKELAQFKYNLYTLYKKTNNAQQAQRYQAAILKDYPESLFAKSILHPEQFEHVDNVDPVLERYYDSTYTAYLRHRYDLVFSLTNKIPKTRKANYLADKFDFLRTLSLGYTQPLRVFEPALKTLAEKYDTTEVGREAKAYLKKIDSNRTEISRRRFALEGYAQDNGFELAERAAALKEAALQAEKDRMAEARKKFYAPDLNSTYQLLILFHSARLNMAPIRLGLSQFSAANFGNDKLKNVLTHAFDGKPALMVGTFSQFKTAMAYYKKFSEDKGNVIPLGEKQYEYYIISNENLKKMTDTAKLQIYREFFDAVYAPYASSNPPDLPPRLTIDTASAKTSHSTGAGNSSAPAFTFDEHSPYLFVLVVNSVHINLNPVRLQMSLFEKANFSEARLQHKTKILNKEAVLISVNSFRDLAAANAYLEKFSAKKDEITGLQSNQYQILLISIANYNKLRTLSDIETFKQMTSKTAAPSPKPSKFK